MIITDLSVIRRKSPDTSIEECQIIGVFEKLEEELKNSERAGIGLAAIQIGIEVRACIIRIKHENGKELNLNMINPVIEKRETQFIFTNEGCLSMPGVCVATDRYAEIVVRWLDYDAKREMRAYFSGLEAVCIQQECDHMDGILVIDREHKKLDKVGRNDPCPCGSGKKYKKCCMK